MASRAQHLQNRYRRLNTGAHWQASGRVAIFRVFSGEFAVRMSALRESARRPATTFGAGALIQSGGKSSREALGANRRLNSPAVKAPVGHVISCRVSCNLFHIHWQGKKCMAAGDVHRTWFPQMIAMLRAEWSKSLSVPEFIALSQRLDDELRRIRSERTPAIRVKNALATANPISSSAAQLISSIEVDRILRSSVLAGRRTFRQFRCAASDHRMQQMGDARE